MVEYFVGLTINTLIKVGQKETLCVHSNKSQLHVVPVFK